MEFGRYSNDVSHTPSEKLVSVNVFRTLPPAVRAVGQSLGVAAVDPPQRPPLPSAGTYLQPGGAEGSHLWRPGQRVQ